MVPVSILVEGSTDEPVAKRLLEYVGLIPGPVYGKQGKNYLLNRLLNYNNAARYGSSWFVIIDLDNVLCPSEAIATWLPEPASKMCCRIAVRSIEAWLMADREQMAAFLSVSVAKIPDKPELEADPKSTLLSIARTSHKKSIREDLVPRASSGAKVGPLYPARITEFVENFWRPEVAAQHSISISRCINALSKLMTST